MMVSVPSVRARFAERPQSAWTAKTRVMAGEPQSKGRLSKDMIGEAGPQPRLLFYEEI